jgi:sulfatase maturation enzyme AslB (radical SAM superfamily)
MRWPYRQAQRAAKCERCWHYRDDVGVNPAHPHCAAAATAICTAAAKCTARPKLLTHAPSPPTPAWAVC